MGTLNALKNIPESSIWAPNPGGQVDFLLCPIREVLLEGPRGTGKTEVLLAKFASQCGKGYGLKWKGVIFRREYKHLDDIVSKSKNLFNQIKNAPTFLSSKSDYKWVFPDGEELLFRAVKTVDDYWSYHGHELPFIGWDELPNWPDCEIYEMFRSINRSPVVGMPRFYGSTANPYGAGHGWVKRYWIDPCPIPSPGGVAIEGVRGIRVRCHVDLAENPFIYENDPEYIESLKNDPNKERRKAWFFGDWNVQVGGYFDGYWSNKLHVVRPFTPPITWRRWRAMDWGFARPYSIGWYTMDPDDTIFRYRELYGWGGKENLGTREYANEVAKRVRGIEKQEIRDGAVFRNNPADSQIWAGEGHEQNIADRFAARPNKILWTPCSKGKGSRVNGWDICREMLAKVRFKVTSDCTHFLRTVPSLIADSCNWEDVDTEQEDHCGDEWRYSMVSRHFSTRNKEKEEIDPRSFDHLTRKPGI